MEHTHLVKGLDYALLDKVSQLCFVIVRQALVVINDGRVCDVLNDLV